MSEPQTEVLLSTPRKPGFQPGHKKFGGRKPGAKNVRTQSAREIAAQLNIEPLAWLLKAASSGVLLNPDGTVTPISSADRIQAMKNVLPFIHSRRSTVHHSGGLDNQVAHAHFDVTHIMLDPQLAAAAETLALRMIDEETGVRQISADFKSPLD